MSGGRQCEGHAQFHRRKPLKASSQSDPLRPHLLCVCFVSFCFLQELPPLIFNCLAFLVFTLRCFHYANTKLVAGLMFFFTFLDGKWD